jgi:hypothetical protein
MYRKLLIAGVLFSCSVSKGAESAGLIGLDRNKLISRLNEWLYQQNHVSYPVFKRYRTECFFKIPLSFPAHLPVPCGLSAREWQELGIISHAGQNEAIAKFTKNRRTFKELRQERRFRGKHGTHVALYNR